MKGLSALSQSQLASTGETDSCCHPRVNQRGMEQGQGPTPVALR